MADPGSPAGVEAPIEVVVADEQAEIGLDAQRWAGLAAAVLRSEGCRGELTLTFVTRDEMADLNREHMGVDGPTDVLSFPLDALEPDARNGRNLGDAGDGRPILLGDVVVCPAVAADAAPTHAGTLADELALLTVHGVLHVLGHDHAEPDEAHRMRTRELELLVEHHWHGPPPPGFVHEQEGS